jgi:hypothetical protein
MSIPIEAYPSSIAMARSPLFATAKNNQEDTDTLTAMTIVLYVYTGDKASTGSADYSLAKTYSIDEVINFEISDLVREFFQHPFGRAFITQPTASETGEVLWVYNAGSVTYSDAGAPEQSSVWPVEADGKWIALDGYKSLGQNQLDGVTQPNLVTLRPFQVLEGASQSLAVSYNTYSLLNGFSIEIDGVEYVYSLYDELGYTYDTVVSNQMVIYLPSGPANVAAFTGIIPTGSYTINLLVNNECISYNDRVKADGGTIEALGCLIDAVDALGGNDDKVAHNFTVLCEPKYTPYLMQFVNKYGVSDYITFFKRSDESGSFTQDQYQKSIYADAFTDVDYNNGKYQSFNINSRNTLTLNTGFVDESYGSIVEEIMMSEKVAIYEGEHWVSVVPQRGSVNYLKSVNDGLINYTLSFTYAFDQRMLIR